MRKHWQRIIGAACGVLLLGALAGCGEADSEVVNSDGGAVTVPNQPSQEAQKPPELEPQPEPEDTGAETVRPEVEGIGMDEASQIALKEFGGKLDNIESDHYDGIPVWEIELENTNKGIDLEVVVDKETGEILHYEED